ncbi:MAG: hypothetical protein H6739_26495 [Alphaproteobacteria bacterium]|nr:hypothetical protein [Alphaproteobacteria bacterium]
MVTLLLLLACKTPPSDDSGATAATLPALAPTALLTRASLDLRGVRPSLSELDAVEADPDSVDSRIRNYLSDPRFGARVRAMWGTIYMTELEYWPHEAATFGLSDEAAFGAAVGQEPLRLLSTLAEQDLPYTEIVRADWTVVDENLAAAYPVDYSGAGWQIAHYTDGRPAAGVMSTNGLWWRYLTSWSNASRARANELSRILMCRDFLEQPVRFDRAVDLSDADRVREALQTDPGCTSCHASLDPFASYLSGFWFNGKAGPEEMVSYHPDREGMWRWLTGVAPGYHGQPGETLDDLGRQMAEDPRLVSCFTQQTFELMLQRPITVDDTAALTAHREAFLDGGLTVRAVMASVLEEPLYRAQPGDGPGEGVQKLASPQLIASQIEGLTGFRFTVDGYDLMNTDGRGLRTLAGGVDGLTSASVARETTPTMLLSVERLAQSAADHAAQQALSDLAGQSLFEAPLDITDPTVLEEQLTLLHRKVLSRRPSEAELDALVSHWQGVFDATGSAAEAWESCVSVLMQHPDFVLY